MSLVCTNINSMMGGRTNLWASGHGRQLAVTQQKEDKVKDEA